ncbi:beta-ketoacyl synthase domain-containing protein [Colletotrichum truncatum]|uniref:Beta-ketoacyl synthase domain-containing protein n=1 Tax=Colletotrichum truncatum TaxID=5467 RepID=A0ACC3ZBD2_COLTU|nr:beta-ketoacyl synthase domain-containing protein [Colletotrichum truncatum]KAF6787753.1 beta-ketoacyl synthase domain-containing protein [Colletotrichum truncatum]
MATSTLNEPIAVVGSGCRFPGGINTPSKLWDELKAPTDLQRPIPKDRFNIDSFYHPDGTHQGRTNAMHAYTLSTNTHAFDAPFFNIQPHEAEAIDPQQRLLLETVYEGISSAGMKVEDLAGSSTAVYVGVMTHDFETNITRDLTNVPTHTATGISLCIASNRLSYFFDWHGPSMTLDTACSSSLVAVHLAVQQLRSGSSKIAVAAGANLILDPMPYVLESKLNMLSPTGRSRMWDASADGYARGEGVACVVLKTLSQALADGDQIECIIRETGVNQDGRTPGITMPNNAAQASLIRETYKKAGLDLEKPTDRCQFFEAHGTGTPAGDPQEAEAISTAFFGHRKRITDEDPLYVGSVKTVIGHTEGTAGIAGLMKASLAVQNGIIPPNLLFDNLSPRVAPYYHDLRILNEAQPWPTLAPGQPRRASVNSFGFGGTNAHAIIENYVPPDSLAHTLRPDHLGSPNTEAACILPLVLSAKSERSLKNVMESLIEFLKANPETQIQDVAWTQLQNRSVLNVRRSIVGVQTLDAAIATLQGEVAKIDAKEEPPIMTTDLRNNPGILGIFTGQGAQWPTMGKKLVSDVPLANAILLELEDSLQTLPEEYRPDWTLYGEMMREKECSNVMNAAFSQPLCTAVQIILVRLLAAAGVNFKAVVGHSSGEIACAYAAGFITASQAIRIAYLRGVVTTNYACSPTGEKGAMLAAGTSFSGALELCALEAFRGRICVAASNSPDSVTLSGDASAVHDMQEVLEDEAKFARLLKVDKAYHSHHMLPCATKYTQAMESCGYSIKAEIPSSTSPIWYSSVREGRVMTANDVASDYWKDNLISPVLFSQALTHATSDNATKLDVAIEVGPHPALKGPALSTMQASAGIKLTYTGCMQRGGDDIDAFASALGHLWERFGSGCLDIAGIINKISPRGLNRSLAKELPRYPWDHSRTYWAASRRAKAFLHGDKPHLLLGKLSPDSTVSSMIWNNFIRPRDIDWLEGHGLQGQTVFPGAGYVIMAMEAALHVASGRKVQLLEVLQLSIDKAITFEDESTSVELSLKADVVTLEPSDPDRIVLTFNIASCLAKENSPSSSARGQIIVTLAQGDLSYHALPHSQDEPPHMNKVNLETFYKELAGIGYQYSKEFREITNMKRVDGKTTGTMAFPKCLDGDSTIVLHPATLDLSFQTIIGAYSSPGDKRLRSLHVPTSIERVAVNPFLCASLYKQSLSTVFFNSSVRNSTSDAIGGDIEVFAPATDGITDNRSTLFQVDGIMFKPFTPPSAADDHQMFSKWIWGPLSPEKLLDDEKYWATEQDKAAMPVMERIVFFYIRTFLQLITEEDKQFIAPYHQQQVKWFEYVLAEARGGRLHAWYNESWETDTQDGIAKLCERFPDHPHVRLIYRIGQNLEDIIIHGTRNPFQLMDHDGLLTEFYANPRSFGPSLSYFQDLSSQIAHRYQNMDILEIGGGTGGATKHILDIPQLAFNTYTFTDISSSFLDKARELFVKYEDRMDFRTLDIRRNPEEQGFKPQQYALIIASNILHATPILHESMKNVRSLLKPGGHVVVMELTHRKHSRLGFIFGLFPDWWAGQDEGRIWEPFVSFDKWDEILRQTGFSGIDSRTLDRDAELFPNSCFSTHALTTQISRLDHPLSAAPKDKEPAIVTIGGGSLWTKAAIEKLRQILPHRRLTCVKSLRDIHETDLETKSTFLVLSDLDDPLFIDLDEDKFEAMKSIFYYASHILWVTENAWVEHPYQAMAIGLLRSVRLEHPEVSAQVLDVDNLGNLHGNVLAEQLLRLEFGSTWQEDHLLWTQEPEIYLSQGRMIIPRLKHDITRNDRLNSKRRPIFTEVNIDESPVRLRKANQDSYLECSVADTHAGLVNISVSFALAKSIRIGNLGYLYVVQGTEIGSSKPVIALSQENASTIAVPAGRVFPLDSVHEDECVLLSIAAEILAQAIISQAAPGTAMIVLEPPHFCIEAIERAAAKAGVRVNFASVHPAPSCKGQWIRLHEKETHSSLLVKAFTPDTSVFYDLSIDQSPFGLARRLAACFPSTVLVLRTEHLIQDLATQTVSSCIPNGYLKHVEQAVAMAVTSKSAPDMVPANKWTGFNGTWGMSTVINWRANPNLNVRIQPIDSLNLFLPTKTYLLVGLAGDLGRSLARWMIKHGACYVVLSSRNPQVNPRWLAETEKMGGNVLVLPMDVSKKASVDTGLETIASSGMPAIGGVAFGPLVLQDILFKNMDLEMMEMVAAPKVTGVRILNEALADSNLDFFVMFSSVVAVLGNPGQSAYSAANSYMHALAQQRRARGLSGSTIDIGAVYGVGYVTRAGREEEFDAVRFLFDTVSEDELHALFAEAVVAGRPDAPKDEDVEVITGVPFIDPTFRDRIPFFDDPRFGYYKLQSQSAKLDDLSASGGSIKDRLMAAHSLDEVRDIVIDGLATKLRSTLQIPPEDSVDIVSPLIDQGVDSLGAVTIGTWFSKQLNLDLPLLKVLGGASISDLAMEAAERLPSSAIPLVQDGSRNDDDGDGKVDSLGDGSKDGSSTEEESGTRTPLTEPEDMDNEAKDPVIVRQEQMSLAQEYSWILQQQADDPTIFNSTIGMFMEGPIDLTRLSAVVNIMLRRHEIFRTRFSEDGNTHVQTVMSLPSSAVRLQSVRVADRDTALEGFSRVEQHKYALADGDTIKLVVFHWSSDQHLLVLGYSRLVGDGQTTENLFNEIGQLYAGVSLPAPVQQYVESSSRQRQQYESGSMDDDIDFWLSLHRTPAAVLPVMSLPGAQTRESATAVPTGLWEQHSINVRLNPMIAIRVKERSRKHKASPLHFYLTAFHVLLARLTGTVEVAVGVADTNRPNLQDVATMGYFANLLPLRMAYAAGDTFGDELVATKEHMRTALQHSQVPYSVLLHRLNLSSAQAKSGKPAPLFQAVFDYRQGQAESGTIGAAKITEVKATRERTPYDVVLEISDDPSKTPLITFKLQNTLYSSEDAKFLANAYLSVLSVFSRNPALKVNEGRLDQPLKGAAV